MNIRKAGKEDLRSLALLFDEYRVFYQKESDVVAAATFLKLRIEKKDSKIYVAVNSEQELMGFIQLYPLFSSTRMRKLWLLNDLYVNPEYRKRGVSIGLIEKAKELVRNSEACGMFLETDKTNAIGNNLYPKTGFELNTSSNFYEWNVKVS